MSITGFADLLHVPLPDPETTFSPEGIFHGSATLTGDATGGTALLSFTSGKGHQFLYVFDSMAVDSGTAETNDLLIIFRLFMSELIPSQNAHYISAGVFNSGVGRRYPITELTPPNAIIGHARLDVVTTALASVTWETNFNTAVYNYVAQGRYYRRSMVNQPGFYRAVLGRG